MSLKNQLDQIIKERKKVTIDELETICHKLGYKLATAERELRPSKNSNITRIYKNGAIIAYAYSEPEIKTDYCCYSFVHFGTHIKDCPLMEQMEKHAKVLEEQTQFQLDLIKRNTYPQTRS